MKVDLLNIKQEILGKIELDKDIFGMPLRVDILHRVVEWQRAKKRSGTHKTKGISEISGTTKKPYKQKGTGNARQGSMRSGQFRGGATIFGPVVRSHEYDMPKKVRKMALKIALSQKLSEGKLLIMQDLKLETYKTSDLFKHVNNMDFKKILIVDGDEVDYNFKKASANIKKIDILPQIGANVYDILQHECLVLTSQAVTKLTERLK